MEDKVGLRWAFRERLAHKVDVEPLVDRRRRRIVNLPAETNARVRQVPASVRDRGSSK